MTPAMTQAKLDLEAIVDTLPLTRAQLAIVVLCALVAMVDGYDTQSIALAAPVIVAAWKVKAAAFGLVFSAGLFGSLVGALSMGVVADRRGRKPALIASMLVFALVTLATPLAHTVPALTVLRFLTGLGLGGALPIIISITSEFAPARQRATIVSLMFCGFPLGAVIGGVAAARLIPALGWPSIFYAGGAAPLLLLPLIAAFVPESVRFMALRRDHVRLGKVLDRMGWAPLWNGELALRADPGRSPVAKLFTEGRAVGTLLLWATLFLSLLLTYFLLNWIPIIARQSGIGMQGAVLGAAAVNLGAILGCLVIGRLADRYGNPTAYISCAFALGAVAIVMIGHAGGSGAWLLWASLLAGVFSVGAQMCTVAFCAAFYDTSLRATGVGWAIGVGRIGAIVGPLLGGMLLAAGTPPPTLFLVVGLMSIGASLAAAGVGFGGMRPRAVGSLGNAA
jgi:AAHS family 4-hydroxybenzoate transporter-like MFS transporter